MTTDERLATLEAQREADIMISAQTKQKVDEIDQKVDDINRKLDRQKGFIAGAMMVLTALWGAIVAAGYASWEYISSRWDFP